MCSDQWENVSTDNPEHDECWRYDLDNFWGDVLFVYKKEGKWFGEASTGKRGLVEFGQLDSEDGRQAKAKTLSLYQAADLET